MFSAAGFQPNELLDFSVAVQDDQGLWVPDIAWAEAQPMRPEALKTYIVPPKLGEQNPSTHRHGPLIGSDGYNDVYGRRGTNINFATSGLGVATSIHITGTGTNNGGHAQTIDQTFNSPGPSESTGLKDDTDLHLFRLPGDGAGSGRAL